MEILGGMAKGISLKVPGGALVRPTAVRARRALFDSLGDLGGGSVCDLFAGQRSCRVRICEPRRGIRIVCGKVAAVTFRAQIESQENRTALFFLPFYRIQRTLPECAVRFSSLPAPDFIFADPPYAESSELLDGLLHEKSFTAWGGTFPDDLGTSGSDFQLKVFPPEWKVQTIKQFGGTRFLYIVRT